MAAQMGMTAETMEGRGAIIAAHGGTIATVVLIKNSCLNKCFHANNLYVLKKLTLSKKTCNVYNFWFILF